MCGLRRFLAIHCDEDILRDVQSFFEKVDKLAGLDLGFSCDKLFVESLEELLLNDLCFLFAMILSVKRPFDEVYQVVVLENEEIEHANKNVLSCIFGTDNTSFCELDLDDTSF